MNLSGLSPEDALELLYDCQGLITHLEIFNLKDHLYGKTSHIEAINALQRAINAGNVIQLKRIIRGAIAQLTSAGQPEARIEKFRHILHNIQALHAPYRNVPLKSRIGSDSTGRSSRLPGMGLALKETLPRRAIKTLKAEENTVQHSIPVCLTAYQQVTYIPHVSRSNLVNAAARMVRRLPVLRLVGFKGQKDWILQKDSLRMPPAGNIAVLGGMQKSNNELYLDPPRSPTERGFSWKYLNSGLKNALKILIGFVPAFATFALTKDWWLLAYFGAFIWFGITGLRNILQSVLGGRGLRRSPLLRWKNYSVGTVSPTPCFSPAFRSLCSITSSKPCC